MSVIFSHKDHVLFFMEAFILGRTLIDWLTSETIKGDYVASAILYDHLV